MILFSEYSLASERPRVFAPNKTYLFQSLLLRRLQAGCGESVRLLHGGGAPGDWAERVHREKTSIVKMQRRDRLTLLRTVEIGIDSYKQGHQKTAFSSASRATLGAKLSARSDALISLWVNSKARHVRAAC